MNESGVDAAIANDESGEADEEVGYSYAEQIRMSGLPSLYLYGSQPSPFPFNPDAII